MQNTLRVTQPRRRKPKSKSLKIINISLFYSIFFFLQVLWHPWAFVGSSPPIYKQSIWRLKELHSQWWSWDKGLGQQPVVGCRKPQPGEGQGSGAARLVLHQGFKLLAFRLEVTKIKGVYVLKSYTLCFGVSSACLSIFPVCWIAEVTPLHFLKYNIPTKKKYTISKILSNA